MILIMISGSKMLSEPNILSFFALIVVSAISGSKVVRYYEFIKTSFIPHRARDLAFSIALAKVSVELN